MFRSDKQVLITGCYRSGTEYITHLLNNHPTLSASMYIVSFMRFCYDRYNPVEEKSNYTKLVFDAGQRIRSRWHRHLRVHKILDYCEEVETVTYAVLYDLMMSDLFLSDQVQSWAEKTQLVWTKIPAFLEMFPQGKVIHIVRDPRSVLASFKKYTYAPEPAYLGAVFNCYDSMSSGLSYQNQYDSNHYRLLRYEDILTAPEKTLFNLFDFLEMSVAHDLLSEEGWQNAWGRPWQHNSAFLPENATGSDFDQSAAINRWKHNLAGWEVALCEAINGELLDRYGYKRSGVTETWPVLIRPLLTDPKLTQYLQRWFVTGQGVEEFPTDPLKSENWEENVEKVS